MKYRNLFVAAAVALSLFACGGGAKQSADKQVETIKIGYLPITHALPVLVAAELQKEVPNGVQIELIKFGSWTELSDALNTGRIDGASMLVQLAMKAREKGIGLRAIALGHTDGNVITVAPNINSAADLKGKTFAIPHRQSSHYLLARQAFANAGVDISEVTIVELPPPDMPSALASGQVQGYCVAEPFGAKAVELGIGKALYESGELWEHSLCCVLVLNDKYLEAHRATAEEFVTAYKNAGKYIENNRDTTFDIISKYLNINRNVYDISLKWISYGDLAIRESDYTDLVNRVKSAGLSENPPTFTEFVLNLGE
ncbi:MAG: ABC transporter substrate-binding protein [Bacteroidales bacterium]|jgi:NitT/TauT family transport system substrate-binding protein|nr:ABC transporter substrate-binding protein [Bacteroidales bacterium]